MAIHNLPNITINGKNKIFGGYIYKISYQQGFFGAASTMTISFLSEDGRYDPPSSLGKKETYKIKLDNDTYEMYAESYGKTRVPGGKNTLDVSFVDASIWLDYYTVGLVNKHGELDNKKLDCLIIVGEEKDPCDGEKELVDGCAGSPSVNQDVETLIDCDDLKATTILDVDYSFEDLIDAMKKKDLKVDNFKDKNPDYRNNYIGGLREVFNNWCSDYGYTYYFDQDSQRIKLIDVASGIDINFDTPDNDILLEERIEETVKGTVNRGAVSYFGAEGQTRCLIDNGKLGALVDFKRLVNCYPILLQSLYPAGLNGVTIDHLPYSCILSKYGSSLRNLYFLYHVHQRLTALTASSLAAVTIPELFMYIYDCYGSNSTNGAKQGIFNALYKDMTDNQIPRASIRFLLVDWNTEKLQEQYSIEQSLATEFLGQYWYADYGRTNVNIKPGPPEIITADGDNALYYDKLSGAGDMFIEVGGDKFIAPIELNRYILVKRNPSYFPTDGLNDLVSYWNNYDFINLGVTPADQIESIRKAFSSRGINVDGLDFARLKILAIQIPPSFTFSVSSDIHPNENLPANTADSGGIGMNYFYGLLDRTTTTLDFNGTRIMTPIGALNSTLNQYKVVINDAFGILNKCKTLGKIEAIYSDLKCDEDYEKTEINFLDITSLNVKDLYSYDNGLQTCVPNLTKIEELHELLNKGLSYSTPKTFKKISYRVGGLINMPKPEDGLLDFVIDIDSAGGIHTSLTVGNTAATPPSLDYSKAKMEFEENNAQNQYRRTLNYSDLRFKK